MNYNKFKVLSNVRYKSIIEKCLQGPKIYAGFPKMSKVNLKIRKVKNMCKLINKRG